MTYRQWSSGTDWSGGGVHQLAFGSSGNIWQRYSQTTGSWGSWARLLNTVNVVKTSNVLQIDGTGNSYIMGNVGIGTTGPAAGSKLDVNGKIYEYGNALLPRGVIVMWSGTLASIPSGWALCNGSNGTPDLRDRFVYGASANENPGAKGGSDSHTHGLSSQKYWKVSSVSRYDSTSNTKHTQELPDVPRAITLDHLCDHLSVGDKYPVGHKLNTWADYPPDPAYPRKMYKVTFDGYRDHSIGASSSLPPYYKLAYIMKL